MTTVLRPVRRWADQPAGFNRAAAETVYKAMMALPDDDTAAIYGRIIVEGLVQHTLVAKADEITKAFAVHEAQAADRLRRELSRTMVAKARSGADASAELLKMAILHKAMDFTDDQRREWARAQNRDLASGRFARNNVKIDYDPKAKALNQAHAVQFGIPGTTRLTDKDDLARYQQAYLQLHGLLSDFTGMGKHALVHLHIVDGEGEPTTKLMRVPERGERTALAAQLKPGEYLHSASVSVAPPMTAAGAAYDALAGIGLPGVGGAAYNTIAYGAGDPDRLARHREALAETMNQDQFVPSQRLFRNLGSSSKLLNDSLSDVAPRKVKYALAVGEHVGRYGPEAQKVIGPTADRAAYRYRGTEKPLSDELGTALANIKTNASVQEDDKREFMLHGRGTGKDWNPSPVMREFWRGLPKTHLNTLQLMSGVVPPSRGVAFDRNGKATVEAVGYGDDHYLPFNLKGQSFRKLKGGEYIRTRTFGGPTTEDIYAGLMSGAKALTVVSHNGVYVVDFNEDLKGGRRFNDAAARMVGRYGHLLDAVRSEQVTTGGIDQSRLDELEEQANVFPKLTHPIGHRAELKRLKAAEKEEPLLSQAQKIKAMTEFLNENAVDILPYDRDTGRDAVLSLDTLTAAYVSREATTRAAAASKQVAAWNRTAPPKDRMPVRPVDDYRAEILAEVKDDDEVAMGEKLAAKLQLSRQLKAHMDKAEEENRIAVSPLRLNGAGYKTALDALKEQFPHYIDRVEFHPWGSEQGKKDSGYVRPRHNRPAEALSGYFDRHVARENETKGKVYADSTRWQNSQRVVREFKAKLTGEAEDGDESASAGGQGAAGAGRGPVKDDSADLQAKADLALFEAYNSATVFGAKPKTAFLEGNQQLVGEELPGVPLHHYLEDPRMKAVVPALVELRGMDREEFMAAYAKDRLLTRKVLAQARSENKNYRYIDDATDAEKAFDRGGQPMPMLELGEHPSDLLGTPDEDIAFPAAPPAYFAENGMGADQIQHAYARDGSIGRLVRAGKLPKDVGSGSFDAQADALLGNLSGQRDALQTRVRNEGLVPSAAAWAAIDIPAEALLRARQLRRSHNASLLAELKHDEGAAEPAGNLSQTLQVVAPIGVGESNANWVERVAMLRDQELAETRQNQQRPFDNGRVIEP